MNVITNGEPRRSYDDRFGYFRNRNNHPFVISDTLTSFICSSFSSNRKKSSASTAEWLEQQSGFDDTMQLTAETQRAVVGQPGRGEHGIADIGQTSQYPWGQPEGKVAPPPSGKYTSVPKQQQQQPSPFETTPGSKVAKNREALEKQQTVQSLDSSSKRSTEVATAAAAATGLTAGAFTAAGSKGTTTQQGQQQKATTSSKAAAAALPTPKAQPLAAPLPKAGVYDPDAAGNAPVITGYDLDDRSVTAKLANRIDAMGGPKEPLVDTTAYGKQAASRPPQEGPLATAARESSSSAGGGGGSTAGKVAGGAALGGAGGAAVGGIVNKCMQYLRGGEPVSSDQQQQQQQLPQQRETVPGTEQDTGYVSQDYSSKWRSTSFNA